MVSRRQDRARELMGGFGRAAPRVGGQTLQQGRSRRLQVVDHKNMDGAMAARFSAERACRAAAAARVIGATRITAGIWRRLDVCGRCASSRAPRAGKLRGCARGLTYHTRATGAGEPPAGRVRARQTAAATWAPV